MSTMNVRFWIGVAVLAGFWLLGLDYFYPANNWAAVAAVVAAVFLLGGSGESTTPIAVSRESGRTAEAVALLLFLPAVWFAAWPYCIAPLLIVLGLGVRLLLGKSRGFRWIATGVVTSGVVLLVQAVTLELYAGQTARSHELPNPLPSMLAGVASLLGMDATANGSNIVMHSMRQTHRLAATWELLIDPATLLFFVGGLVMLAMQKRERESGKAGDDCSARSLISVRVVRSLAVIALCWLPVRAGLLMAVYLHRVLRTAPEQPLHAMNHFFSPWVLLGLLVVPALAAWRFVRFQRLSTSASLRSAIRNPKCESQESPFILTPSPFASLVSVVLVAIAAALWTVAIYWNPVGVRREGRVMVVERHSQWEPTTKPYDTKWFAEPRLFGESSGYNYAAIFDYLGQYYQMSRLLGEDKIDDRTLAQCDVLVIKTPTERYSAEEAAAVVRFVEGGGGLLLIGDHTNFSRSSTAMNDITRPMGFIFRDDLLFALGKFYDNEWYRPPLMPHPIVGHIPPMYFSVSCSIDPGQSHGRAAITNTGLWSMGPDYHAENFHPIPQHCPEMRYGAFVQVWAAWHGQGRAIAFTDSTIFSNFCTFQPGHAELMLGMVEWLNHANPRVDPRPWLLLLGLLMFVGAIVVQRRRGGQRTCQSKAAEESPARRYARCRPLVLLAAGTCGWVLGGMAVVVANRWATPTPACQRPQQRVVIDRTTSAVPLAKGMYLHGEEKGYGMLEAWIPRLGCYTVRKRDDHVFSGDALVVICPSRQPADRRWIARLVEYVRRGGRLLVIDSPENAHSRANMLLEPFGLSFRHDKVWAGDLITAGQTASISVPAACQVVGGQPIATLPNGPVAAAVKFGKGFVLAVGFGSVWNDTRMGETWMLEPDATVKSRYEALFGVLRTLLNGKLPEPVPARKPLKDIPLKESGIGGM